MSVSDVVRKTPIVHAQCPAHSNHALCGARVAYMDPDVDVVTAKYPEITTCLTCLAWLDKK